MSHTTVFLEGLVAQFHVGVPEEERAEWQPLHIDIACDLDQLRIMRDDIGETLNYALIYERVHEIAQRDTFVLLETLAEVIALVCLEDKRVQRAKVRIRKPNKLTNCAFVGTERTFGRSEVSR